MEGTGVGASGVGFPADLYKRRYSAKETCNFIDATDRSHPIEEHRVVAEIKLQVSFAEYSLF